jgi:hypothetical protein
LTELRYRVQNSKYISENPIFQIDVSWAKSDTDVTRPSWVSPTTKNLQRLQITKEPALAIQAEEKIRYTLTNCGVTRLSAPVLRRRGDCSGQQAAPEVMLVEILQQMLFKPKLLKNRLFHPNKDHFLQKFITLFILTLNVSLFTTNEALFVLNSLQHGSI